MASPAQSRWVGELAEVPARRKAARQVKFNGSLTLSSLIFHSDGLPVNEFRKSWRTACKRARVCRLFHDLRRSAVRDLVRSGVSQSVAMSISGHRTASMFSSYNITDDRDQRKALRMREKFVKTVKESVVAMAARS